MKHTLLLLAALAAVATVSAEKITLTRLQASELYVALATIDSGLSPSNTVAAADNINALRPAVEALDKGKVAYQRAVRALAKANPADLDAQVEKLNAEIEGKADDPITVDLTSFTLTDDEITQAKVKPNTLATLRRHLKPRK